MFRPAGHSRNACSKESGYLQKKKDNLRFRKLWISLAPFWSLNYGVIIPFDLGRTHPNFVGFLWTLAKALRVFWAIGRAFMTSQSRCAKDSALVRHKILSSSRTSGEHRVLADVLLKNFVAAAVFSVSYFLNVVKEFRSCVSTNFLQCFLHDFS